MSRTAFLIIVAIVSIVYGLGLLVVPTQFVESHSIASSPEVNLISRFNAAYLLGFGVTAWLARNAGDSDGLKAILYGGLVISILVFLIALVATLTGQINVMGWVPVVLYLLISVGFAYFGFLRPSSA